MRWGLLLLAAVGVAVLSFVLTRRSEPSFALRSVAITLPAETETLPAGPHVDLVMSRCTACHSAAMLLHQPLLSHDQWQASVTKMREVYRAPIDEADVPLILTYLDGLSAVKAP